MVRLDLNPVGPHFVLGVYNVGDVIVDATIVLSGFEAANRTWGVTLRRKVLAAGSMLEFDPPEAIERFERITVEVVGIGGGAVEYTSTDSIEDVAAYLAEISAANWIVWDSPERAVAKAIVVSADRISAALEEHVGGELARVRSVVRLATGSVQHSIKAAAEDLVAGRKRSWWDRLLGRG